MRVTPAASKDQPCLIGDTISCLSGRLNSNFLGYKDRPNTLSLLCRGQLRSRRHDDSSSSSLAMCCVWRGSSAHTQRGWPQDNPTGARQRPAILGLGLSMPIDLAPNLLMRCTIAKCENGSSHLRIDQPRTDCSRRNRLKVAACSRSASNDGAGKRANGMASMACSNGDVSDARQASRSFRQAFIKAWCAAGQ